MSVRVASSKLVCNAASDPYYGPLAGISDAQFRKILENNVLSNHWLIQMVAPGMVARRDGAIVIVSSIGALKGSPVIGAYIDRLAAAPGVREWISDALADLPEVMEAYLVTGEYDWTSQDAKDLLAPYLRAVAA